MPRCLGEGDLEDICLENMDEESCIGACTWLEDQCADITIEDPNPSIDGDEQIAGIELIDNIDNKLDCENSLEDYMWFGNNVIEYNSTAYQYEYIVIEMERYGPCVLMSFILFGLMTGVSIFWMFIGPFVRFFSSLFTFGLM